MTFFPSAGYYGVGIWIVTQVQVCFLVITPLILGHDFQGLGGFETSMSILPNNYSSHSVPRSDQDLEINLLYYSRSIFFFFFFIIIFLVFPTALPPP